MLRRVAVLAALSSSACDFLPSEEPGPCDDLTGGALVTLDVVGEDISLWITDDAFIDEALEVEHRGASAARVPLFSDVVAGTTCDPRWEFHVAPDLAEWADVAIELCDATPSHVDAYLAEWIIEVHAWCPWEASVQAVDDRR